MPQSPEPAAPALPSVAGEPPAAAVVDVEPPIPYSRFVKSLGVNRTTAWRYRSKGIIEVVNLGGRLFVFQSAIARFNARLAAGQFAKPVKGFPRGDSGPAGGAVVEDGAAED